MTSTPAVSISALCHRYRGAKGKPDRLAIDHLDLTIPTGELFVLLGPNGGGKTTLFRVLSTLIPPQSGEVSVLGYSLPSQQSLVQQRLGVVFQAASLDRKLTIGENIRFHAAMYGLSGAELESRVKELLNIFALADREKDLVETLSGGLRRRVELAKGLIHRPQLLLLDEPSTGLDPGARSDLWRFLRQIQSEQQMTIILTTHLLEEADFADRIGILSEGKLVALDSPVALKAAVGGDSVILETDNPEELKQQVESQMGFSARIVDSAVRLEIPEGHRHVASIVEAFPGKVKSLRLGKPSLEDVFIAKTGHRFWDERQAN